MFIPYFLLYFKLEIISRSLLKSEWLGFFGNHQPCPKTEKCLFSLLNFSFYMKHGNIELWEVAFYLTLFWSKVSKTITWDINGLKRPCNWERKPFDSKHGWNWGYKLSETDSFVLNPVPSFLFTLKMFKYNQPQNVIEIDLQNYTPKVWCHWSFVVIYILSNKRVRQDKA